MAATDGQGARRADPRRREIVTPEGVAFPVRLADRSERLGAVLIDLLIIFGSLILIFTVGLFGMTQAAWLLPLVILASFAVRSFYFIAFELRWQGRTPGKRLVGLRVIDRHGGPLRPDAIFARNLMREIELFMPATLLLLGERGGVEGWFTVLVLIWLAVFVLMPFFNRDRMRVGDLIAGTWVIVAPRTQLLQDLAKPRTAAQGAAAAGSDRYRFTKAQLDIYGIYELQVLEDVLRNRGSAASTTLHDVCRRIQRKIGWRPEVRVTEARFFLEAFYAQLRAHLEAKMLMGVRRESKHDRGGS